MVEMTLGVPGMIRSTILQDQESVRTRAEDDKVKRVWLHGWKDGSEHLQCGTFI